MAKAPSPNVDDFWKRVHQVIDRFEYGNVSAASRRMRNVSQRGLSKVYNGETRNPGVEVAAAILTTYPTVDPAWLILGIGSEQWTESEGRVQQLARELVVETLTKGLVALGGEGLEADGTVTANKRKAG